MTNKRSNPKKAQIKPAIVAPADLFLQALKHGSSVSAACLASGVARTTAYSWRSENLGFRKAWEEAEDAGTDRLEDELLARATDGKDTTALIFALKARRPKKYRERMDIEVTGGISLGEMDDNKLNAMFESLLRKKLAPVFLVNTAPTLDDLLAAFRITPLPAVGQIADGTAKVGT